MAEKKPTPPAPTGRYAYDGLDRVLHEKARLGIMTSLVTRPTGLSFNDLKQACASAATNQDMQELSCGRLQIQHFLASLLLMCIVQLSRCVQFGKQGPYIGVFHEMSSPRLFEYRPVITDQMECCPEIRVDTV